MINIKKHKAQIIQLLGECMFPNQERIVQEYMRYKKEQGRLLLGRIENEQLVGLLGIIWLSDVKVELKHIAIHAEHRK
jgi:hypothetical protein